jgi:hypothetical protein
MSEQWQRLILPCSCHLFLILDALSKILVETKYNSPLISSLLLFFAPLILVSVSIYLDYYWNIISLM